MVLGRRFKEMSPRHLKATTMPEAPILVGGGWQETTEDEVNCSYLNCSFVKKIVLTSKHHLPELFLRQKKALLPQFKQARKNKQKVFWRVENGNYCMYCSLMMKKFMHRQLLSPINSL